MVLRIVAIVAFYSLCSLQFAYAQEPNRYIVYFTDKNNSPYSINAPQAYLSQRAIDRRTRQNIAITSADLPVDSAYLDFINATGAQVIYASRWFNAAVIGADSLQLVQISKLSFVKSVALVRGSDYYARLSQPVTSLTSPTNRLTSTPAYMNQLSMIGVDSMHLMGYHGEGMLITILDAGFINATNRSFFDSLYANQQVIATYDFVLSQPNVYQSDDHGTQVLSVLAANEPGQLMGAAYKANYILLVTEDVTSESPVEEANWLRGAEYADSAGTDIISSSLGYNLFDNSQYNLTYSNLNGHTSIVSRAASMAAARGILVCNSAGNEGGDSWKYIIVPADADSIIAVGAVDASGARVYFSSIGPTSDGRIKPDLAAQGGNTTVGLSTGSLGSDVGTDNGTSFSCPLIAGLAAGFWQAFPQLKNVDVIQYLERSASQYANPDNLLGYGIPYFPKAYDFAGGITYVTPPPPRTLKALYPNPVSGSSSLITAVLANDTGPATYELFDVTGKMIESASAQLSAASTLELEVNNLIQGMYIISITSSSGTYRTKFIKIK